MSNNPSAVREKTKLRWRLTGQPGAYVWTLFEGETELGHIKVGPSGYGWYIQSTGEWGIVIHFGRRFDQLSDAAKRLHRYWSETKWRPEPKEAATEVA